MRVTGFKLIAEEGFIAASSCTESTAPLSQYEDNSGDNGAILSNKFEAEVTWISREYNHQGSEDDASNISSISFEEVSALEVNSERNSTDHVEDDVKGVAEVDLAGDDDDGNNRSDESDDLKSSESFLEVPQQKKIRKAESQYLLELNNIPLWGFTSICGRRPEMEDALSVVPRCLQAPKVEILSKSNGMNYNSLSRSTAHFYGVYDGHGGCQVYASWPCPPPPIFS